METLNYKSKVKTTLYAYLKKKTKISASSLEQAFSALVNNDKYLNFSPETSAKIIELHDKFLSSYEPARAARVKVTATKSLHTKASNALAKDSSDAKAQERQELASKTLPVAKKDFMEKVDVAISCLIELNNELNGIIEEYNTKNPSEPFIANEPETLKPILKDTSLVPYKNTTTLPVAGGLSYLTDAPETSLENIVNDDNKEETKPDIYDAEFVDISDDEDKNDIIIEQPEVIKDKDAEPAKPDVLVTDIEIKDDSEFKHHFANIDDEQKDAEIKETTPTNDIADNDVKADNNPDDNKDNNSGADNGSNDNSEGNGENGDDNPGENAQDNNENPQDTQPVINDSDTNNPETPKGSEPPTPPAPPTPPTNPKESAEKPAQEAKKGKDDKPKAKTDVKGLMNSLGDLGFVIAVLSIALLLAGVGVGFFLLPTLAVAGTATCIAGKVVNTMEFAEKAPKQKKDKKEKTGKKNRTKDKTKNRTKDKTKQNAKQSSKQKPSEFIANMFNKKSTADVSRTDDVSPTPTEYRFSETPEQTKTLENNIDNSTRETISEELKSRTLDAINSVKNTSANPASAEFDEALKNLDEVLTEVNPENLEASAFAEVDQEFIQSCIDFKVNYIAYNTSVQDVENAQTTPQTRRTKPNIKSEQESNNHKIVVENNQKATLKILTDSIDAIENAVNPQSKSVAQKPTSLAQVTPTKDPLNKVIDDIKVVYKRIVATGASNQEDYYEIINCCNKTLECVNNKQSPTKSEIDIANSCKKIVEQETERCDIIEKAEQLKQELEELDKRFAQGEEINADRVDVLKNEIKTAYEKHFTLASAITQNIKELGEMLDIVTTNKSQETNIGIDALPSNTDHTV